MSPSERLAIAAHLHVLLRRKLGRVTDTEWMASNADYAREILKVCRAESDPDLHDWAGKLEQVLRALSPKATSPETAQRGPWAGETLPAADPPAVRARSVEQRYVGRLR